MDVVMPGGLVITTYVINFSLKTCTIFTHTHTHTHSRTNKVLKFEMYWKSVKKSSHESY